MARLLAQRLVRALLLSCCVAGARLGAGDEAAFQSPERIRAGAKPAGARRAHLQSDAATIQSPHSAGGTVSPRIVGGVQVRPAVGSSATQRWLMRAPAQVPAPNVTAPWQARLLLCYATSGCYICGGTLITPQVVMTAAHCVHDTPSDELQQVSVNLGASLERSSAACVAADSCCPAYHQVCKTLAPAMTIPTRM